MCMPVIGSSRRFADECCAEPLYPAHEQHRQRLLRSSLDPLVGGHVLDLGNPHHVDSERSPEGAGVGFVPRSDEER
jgi:hypothetical protein